MMRLFVAVTLDAASKDRLSRHIAALRKSGCQGNFTLHDNLHLTLAFIGGTDRIGAARAAVDACAARHRGFDLQVAGSGRFGDILWAGAQGEGLAGLAADMADCLWRQGFDIEKRPFKAHITLARKYAAGPGELPELRPFTCPVTGISLMESARVGGRLTYIERYSKELL